MSSKQLNVIDDFNIRQHYENVDGNKIINEDKTTKSIVTKPNSMILSFGAKGLLDGDKIQYLYQSNGFHSTHDHINAFLLPRNGLIKNIYVFQEYENWSEHSHETVAQYSLCFNDTKVVSFDVTTHARTSDTIGPIKLYNNSNLIEGFAGDLVSFTISPKNNHFMGGKNLLISMEFE